jgi:hypothetical protein
MNKTTSWIKNNYLKILGFIGILYFVVVTFLFTKAYSSSLNISTIIDTKAFADYGSHLAGIGAIFAFFFAFATFWKIESTNRKKDFETTFFNMLTHFDSIIAQIKVSNENRALKVPNKIQLDKDYYGRTALNVLLEDFIDVMNSGTTIDEFIDDYPENVTDLIPVRWNETYERNLESLPHYFRYYYTMVKFIMKSDKGIDKKFYANLLQAKISSSEMGLIFYNTFYNNKISQQRGAIEFKAWLNDSDISLFENIDERSVLSIDDLKSRCPNIKFKFEQTTKKNL